MLSDESNQPVEPATLDLYFPGVIVGDFSDVDNCLAKAPSCEDLVAYLDEKPDEDDSKSNDGLGVCMAMGKVSSQADLVDLSEKLNLEEMELVPMDLDEVLQYVKEEEQEQKEKQPSTVSDLPASLTGLALSPGTPAEASDHSVTTTPQLPSLPVLGLYQAKQQPPVQQTPRSVACQPLLNSFETMADPADSPKEEAATAAAAPSPRGKSTVRRRASAASGADQSNKTYEALCQKNRIFDSSAKARYLMDQQLQRDAIVESIVGYVKRCLDPERDRVHRFLMVMLVDGQLEQGPYWRFFQDAVYFCDARKERLVGEPGPMFHIRQSAYVGLLWGRYKGNECCDYATLGDAINLIGKPKRLFQFGEVAFKEICRYRAQRVEAGPIEAN
uniref:CKK domain-containing protein n=1 Tax=Macrostomum lignano TaxID=282301 RepID=A0A1I8HDV1_9PLAT